MSFSITFLISCLWLNFHSFSKYAKLYQKLIFLGNFAYVLNEWSLFYSLRQLPGGVPQKSHLKKSCNWCKLWHRCFPVNFCKDFQDSFSAEYLWATVSLTSVIYKLKDPQCFCWHLWLISQHRKKILISAVKLIVTYSEQIYIKFENLKF